MILAIDVNYRLNDALAVGFLFDWKGAEPLEILKSKIFNIEEYVPGEFYKRELPCILEIASQTDLNSLNAIVIDGYVYIDNELTFGLGGKLWEVLGANIPVIGVAKTTFYNNKKTVMEVYRGESKKPLYISAVGIELNKAANRIREMEGEFRIPTILKQLDIITKDETVK